MTKGFSQFNLVIRLAKLGVGVLTSLSLFFFACRGQQSQPQQDPDLPSSKITIQLLPVENGRIKCETKDGSTFKSFNDVASGTQLTFMLIANDGFTPSRLVIDKTEYKTLTVDGLIKQEVTVNKSFKVSGECVKKSGSFELDVESVEYGEITCKTKDGKAFDTFKKCKEGTILVFILKSTNVKYKPKKLTIGAKDFTMQNSSGEIEGEVTVKGNLSIRGEMERILENFKVEIKAVENGSISCKTKEGNPFTSFTSVQENSVLIFTLSATNTATHIPSKLIIDGTEYKTLDSEGNIEKEITITKNIEVSGECKTKDVNAKYKILITQPENGSITCTKEDGGAIDNINEVPHGTKVKIVLQANANHHAKMLKIGDAEIRETSADKTKIEKIWTIQQDLELKGECVAYFHITINPVENGNITCKLEDGTELQSTDLNEIEKGTSLTFTLKANTTSFVPKELKIDNIKYTEIVDSSISSTIEVSKAHIVEGVVVQATLALKKITFWHQRLEPIVIDSKAIEGQADSIFTLPAVPLKIDALDLETEVEPSNATVTYTPLLQDEKWKLEEGENTLELSIEDSGVTKKYTFKITRVDIELKTLTMVHEKYPDGGNPKQITFTQGDWKDNQHFTFVDDIDGDTYLSFALKEGVYEYEDDDERHLFKYTATLKTNPPKEISGDFWFTVRNGNPPVWDYPPIAIDKDSYNDVDPLYDDSFSPHIKLDATGLGMWIPTHIFAADFEAIKGKASLEAISFVVEDVTENIQDDMDDNKASIVKFGGNGQYALKDCKDLKIANTTQKILVHVLPEYAGVKVTGISWKGEGTIAPSGEGSFGYYRYIDFNNTNTEKKTLVISYQSQDGKKKKHKDINIERSNLSGNAKISSIKICGVQAVLEDGSYIVKLKKTDTHIGKIEIVLEDPSCPYTVYTFEQNADGEWERGDNVTHADNVDFSKKENQELGIFITPPLGKLYERFFDMRVIIEE
jgi:lipoprotein